MHVSLALLGHVEKVAYSDVGMIPVLTPLSFFCAMIAAITLRFLDPFGTGKLVLFQVTYDKVIIPSLLFCGMDMLMSYSGLACV